MPQVLLARRQTLVRGRWRQRLQTRAHPQVLRQKATRLHRQRALRRKAMWLHRQRLQTLARPQVLRQKATMLHRQRALRRKVMRPVIWLHRQLTLPRNHHHLLLLLRTPHQSSGHPGISETCPLLSVWLRTGLRGHQAWLRTGLQIYSCSQARPGSRPIPGCAYGQATATRKGPGLLSSRSPLCQTVLVETWGWPEREPAAWHHLRSRTATRGTDA